MKKRYTDAELQKIYKRVDIEKFFKHYNVNILGKCGSELRMRCIIPGHRDVSPSANFNIEKGLYNCFVCGGRNFFMLVKDLENLPSFNVAVEFVKKMVGFEEDEEIGQIDSLLEELKEIQIEDDTERVPEYLEIDLCKHAEFEDAFDHFLKVKRRVSKQMIHLWNLKYAVGGYYVDRLVVPITHEFKTMSFAARDMSGRSEKWLKLLKQAKKDRLTVTELAELRVKYECKKILYPPILDKADPDKPDSRIIYGTAIQFLMFNFDNVIKRTRDYVILVEGVFDAMRLFTLGFNAVAILGTKLSGHNKSLLLANFDRVFIALDNDAKDDGSNPGQVAAQKILEELRPKVEAYNIVLPPGKDPDQCTIDEFKQCLKASTQNNELFEKKYVQL